jgi:cytochrome c peroxidase
MKKPGVLLVILVLIASAYKEIGSYEFIVPNNWPKPVYDFNKNPLTNEKILLGRVLFYDPILSKDNTISCSSCHSQYSAFAQVDHPLSSGINNQIGKRNSPALMNLAWNSSFMWDGAVNHLDMQALAPMSNPVEMNEIIGHVVEKLQRSPIYPKLFYNAYGDSVITSEKLLKSISQFMLTLVSCHSKYDSVMQKQASFTEQEKNGYQLFRKNCSSCHKEPLFTNNQFENNGLPIDTSLKDVGRMLMTQDSANYLQFKVPTLRNIQYTYPYMHDGRFANLKQVLDHYTNGIVRYKNLSKQLMKPIILSSNEKVDIIAFLYTLSDKDFILDKRFSYPRDILH